MLLIKHAKGMSLYFKDVSLQILNFEAASNYLIQPQIISSL